MTTDSSTGTDLVFAQASLRRLDLDEQGARILHGIVADVLPGFRGPAAGRVRQIRDALEEQL